MRILLTKRHRHIAWTVLALAFPVVALADLSQTTTMATNTRLNLDTGATPSSGGDLLWSGSSMTPQGTAKAANLASVGAAAFASLPLSTVQTLLMGTGSNAPIASSVLTVGDVFLVLTNGGNYAKLLVTANSGGSITLQFTTFGVSGGGGGGPTAPTITDVQNNSSVIPAGFPNSGVSPSSLFVIHGNGLADAGSPVLQDSTKGLPLTLNGASISVTVNGMTVHPAIYYTCSGALHAASGCGSSAPSPAQIAAVLPAATPLGTGTITVTYNGTPSAAAPIQVIASAPGLTTYNGSVVAQIANTAPIITYTSSAKPGDIIILWGTGLGADAADSDTTYTGSPHQIGTSLTVYIGGAQVTSIAYQGQSVYPGVHVIGLTIPQGVPTGCYVPIAVVAGSVVSNIVTLPIAAGGGVCSDPQYGIDGNQISTFGGQTTVKSGSVTVSQFTAPGLGGAPVTGNNAGAFFSQIAGASYAGGGGFLVSIGGCVVIQSAGSGGGAATVTGLDAGTITVTGPGGTPITLAPTPNFAGSYNATLPSIPSTGGAYVFNGSGGAQVGKFTATVNFPNPLLSWTNQSAAATVNRSQGLLVTWTGGAPGTYVTIVGNAFNISANVFGTYLCIAPVAAGQLTVPPYITLTLPAGTGSTNVQNSTNYSTFTASGLDFGYAIGSVSIGVSSTYN